ncbi:all-trans-retinol 13,14-reductase, partial [Flavihumibacter sp. CACIAM 22H1]|uniref:phytoene desaturase family protein n=1 Tax=Flavihumibacter sp. CACIAM 22H1 TaxID=1812911 RepID=UPI0007A8F6DC
AQGYENFSDQLKKEFPEEADAIDRYCEAIRSICARFPMYNLRTGEGMQEKLGIMEMDTLGFLEQLTANRRLQEVLAGNNFLYAGEANKTPFYVHALVVNSYLESAWKMKDGGSQITRHLVKLIRAQGGELFNHTEVVKLEGNEEGLTAALTSKGQRFSGRSFISNLHPKHTLRITDSPFFRTAYRSRIAKLENTVSSFSIHAVLKPGTVPYPNHNYYLHKKDGVWSAVHADPLLWPLSVGVFFTKDRKNPGFAESMSLLTYMSETACRPWKESFNTDSRPSDRGQGYEAFKATHSAQLLELVAQRFPELPAAIQSYTSATPLSFRDYIGTEDGSLYGIAKDYRNPMGTYLPTRTKVPNLFLTGQNILLHGILGVTITALTTCAEFIPVETLLEKIKLANENE